MITVLVVEDSPSERELLTTYLTESGYNVIIAENGKEGLQKAGEHKPNVVVTDVVMPEMNGFELCRSIKKIQRHSKFLSLPVPQKIRN